MATRDQIEQALRAADAAGNVEDARRLAEALKGMSEPSAPPAGDIHAAGVKSAFNDLPWYLKVAQAADDTVRTIANGVTLGYADKLASAMNGDPLVEERQKSADARTRAGSAAYGADAIGLAIPGSVAEKGVAKLAPAIADSGWLSTLLRGTGAGTAVGTGMAAGNDTNLVEGALEGAVGGIGGAAVGKTLGSVANYAGNKIGLLPGILSDTRVPRKSLDEVKAAKNDAYQAVDDAGIRYAAPDVKTLGRQMKQDLVAENVDPVIHPKAVQRAKRFDDITRNRTKTGIPLWALDNQRQAISRDVTGPESAMGDIMRRNIDKFIETKPPLNASSADADSLVKTAREMNRKYQVYKQVDRAVRKGVNAGTRAGEISPFRSIANSDMRGISPKEQGLIDNVVQGHGWQEMLARKGVDLAGKLGSFGSGAAAGGIAFGGAPGALAGGLAALTVPPLVKGAARSYTKRNIEALLDELGGGSQADSLLKEILKHKLSGIGAGMLYNSDPLNQGR